MNVKLSKNKKIIILISGFGVLTTSIVTPLVVINSNENDNQESENKIKEIISKIKDQDILIAPNVLTQTQSQIQEAIKNQLQKENQTLTLNDLSKISTNLSSLTLGNRIEVTLIIKVNSVSQDLKIHVEKVNLLKNSNITDGIHGTIFQDSFKNLWAMGNETKLQVLKVNQNDIGYVSTWNSNNNVEGLLNGSNITNGYLGQIFQDQFKNLWAMGFQTKFQVLKVNNSKNGYVSAWNNDNTQGLLNGSNINSSYGGRIFQDSFKNLWAMGNRAKLQVLKANSRGDGYVSAWSNNNQGLLNGSNITNGAGGGTIFQDFFGNLWAMGRGTKLQVLKVNSNKSGYVSEGWTNNTSQGLLNGSNIIDGIGGRIFQDQFKNLWAMGEKTKLQVLKVNSRKTDYVSAWADVETTAGLLNGSNITDGYGGRIFQDQFKNLWAMGFQTKFQVLKVNNSKNGYVSAWTNDNTQGLLNGSNIANGNGGRIFQDSFRNLWAMGKNTKFQVLKVNNFKNGYVSAWTDDTTSGLLNGSNINNGYVGRIFQDSFKNLWAMGREKKLQVLKVNVSEKSYVKSWQI